MENMAENYYPKDIYQGSDNKISSPLESILKNNPLFSAFANQKGLDQNLTEQIFSSILKQQETSSSTKKKELDTDFYEEY